MATRYSTATIRQMLRARMPGREAEVLVQVFDAMAADLTAAEAVATTSTAALATYRTAFNTAMTKLNADAGVTDTNYALIP